MREKFNNERKVPPAITDEELAVMEQITRLFVRTAIDEALNSPRLVALLERNAFWLAKNSKEIQS